MNPFQRKFRFCRGFAMLFRSRIWFSPLVSPKTPRAIDHPKKPREAQDFRPGPLQHLVEVQGYLQVYQRGAAKVSTDHKQKGPRWLNPVGAKLKKHLNVEFNAEDEVHEPKFPHDTGCFARLRKGDAPNWGQDFIVKYDKNTQVHGWVNPSTAGCDTNHLFAQGMRL